MKSSYRPKKYLGQNFLTNAPMRQKIVQACAFGPEDTVVEIGPGQGALTQLIAPLVNKLICVETDRDLIEPLICHSRASGNPVEVIHADFLKWDWKDVSGPVKVFGNIPYNISTPIIENLIAHREKMSSSFLTVQLEFGQRLAAQAGGKDYGSLTCFAQFYADINILFKIKNTCFKPVPKVDSCFLRMDFRPWSAKVLDEAFLFKLIQTAFSQRRKNIVNTLKGLVPKEKLEQALISQDIKLEARPENLTLENYIKLAAALML